METIKKLPIEGVIITPDDIRNLNGALVGSVSAAPPSKGDVKYFYSLQSRDTTEWRSTDADVLDLGGPLDTDALLHIRMEGGLQRGDKTLNYAITCRLSHASKKLKERSDDNNTIIVAGDDEDWVLATYQRLTEWLRRLQPQSGMKGMYHALLMLAVWAGFILISALFTFLFAEYVFPRLTGSPVEDMGDLVAGLGVMAAIIGAIVVIVFSELLSEAYPKVDIRTGPSYMQTSHRTRRVLRFLGGAVAVPFVLSVMAGLVVAVFSN